MAVDALVLMHDSVQLVVVSDAPVQQVEGQDAGTVPVDHDNIALEAALSKLSDAQRVDLQRDDKTSLTLVTLSQGMPYDLIILGGSTQTAAMSSGPTPSHARRGSGGTTTNTTTTNNNSNNQHAHHPTSSTASNLSTGSLRHNRHHSYTRSAFEPMSLQARREYLFGALPASLIEIKSPILLVYKAASSNDSTRRSAVSVLSLKIPSPLSSPRSYAAVSNNEDGTGVDVDIVGIAA